MQLVEEREQKKIIHFDIMIQIASFVAVWFNSLRRSIKWALIFDYHFGDKQTTARTNNTKLLLNYFILYSHRNKNHAFTEIYHKNVID